jgi:hypothetical protein
MTISPLLLSNKKILAFLLAFQEEIELQKSDPETVSFKYKNLSEFFGDEDEIIKYLKYLDKDQNIVRLKFISKQKIRDKKIPNDVYITEITPDNDLLSGDDFYEVRRYHKINYYPEDLFVFEYDEQKIQQTLNYENEIDYTSKAERGAWEKKWDVLQAIWTAYKTLNNPKNILIPVRALIIKGRDESLISMILSDYTRIGCFNGFSVDENNYILYKVNNEKLKEIYQKTKTIYEKFAQVYQEKIKEENAYFEALERRAEKSKEMEEIANRVFDKIKEGKQTKEETETPNQTIKPYTQTKDGKGYFKFYKEGENIEIGKTNTRHFRLLQCLCEPRFGIQKTIEAVFQAIRLPKDENDNDLLTWSQQRKNKMLTLIEYAKKELQKNKKIQRKIHYKFDNQKKIMWLELEE